MKQKSFKIKPKKFFYQIQEEVAEGLSSNVYKALKKYSKDGPSHTMALKVFKSKKDIQKWKKEFQILSQVSSPYCVKLFGWEVLENSKLTLLLEWIEGVHLYDLFLMKKLNLDEIQNLCFQIHEGLKDLKKKKSFHGDLNPFNVLINTAGRVKLIDFGMVWPNFKEKKSRKKNLSIQGTLKFIAPEILKGHPPDYSSDLYSLGTLMKFLFFPHSKELPKKFHFLKSCLELNPKKRNLLFQPPNRNLIEKKMALKVQKILKRKMTYPEKESKTKKLNQSIPLLLSSSKTHFNSINPLKKFAPHLKLLKSRSYKKEKTLPRWGFVLTFFIFFLFPLKEAFFLKKDLIKPTKKAHLIISTHHWFEISINGKKKGFSPLNLKNIQPGVLIIKARSMNQTYLKTLTLSEGEKRVLNDHFFNPNLNLNL